jgi:hypothetical protein
VSAAARRPGSDGGGARRDRFDFDATSVGAEWIDELAREARPGLDLGPVVVGHTDWRAENMRFEDDRVTAVYDWESLRLAPEPVFVGAAALGPYGRLWSTRWRIRPGASTPTH